MSQENKLTRLLVASCFMSVFYVCLGYGIGHIMKPTLGTWVIWSMLSTASVAGAIIVLKTE